MRNFRFLLAAFLVALPANSIAQVDPDWSRREMERMQAQQERWEAQNGRLRAEQERWDAQNERLRAEQERQAARAAPQRAARGGGSKQGGSETASIQRAAPNGDAKDRMITMERIRAVFKVAPHICRVSQGPKPLDPRAFETALDLLSEEEDGLLLFFCGMYSLGSAEAGEAPKSVTSEKR